MNKFLIPLLMLFGVCSCTRIVSTPSAENYTIPVYTPTFATGFRIYSLPADSTLMALEVYRPDTMKIAIPAGGFHSLLCMSSTYIGGLSTLGADSLIVAVSGRDYLTNNEVKNRAADVGYEGAMDYEQVLTSKPDLALIYGIGGRSSIEEKLKELRIPYVYINDFEEQSPLGRAEWIVALGALAGVDGIDRFTQIANAYLPSDGGVAVMLNAPYSGSWFIPGRDNYISRLIRDAGGEIIIDQEPGANSSAVDLEATLPALSAADIWLNPGQVADLDGAKRLVPKAKFSAQVWNQTPDFFESGASRPDLVLDELKAIFSGAAPDSMQYFIHLK